MKIRTLLISGLLMLVALPASGADDLAEGFHGMKWGSNIKMHSNLVPVHTRAPVVYCVNSEVAYQVSGTQVTNVIYGFYQDQLFAAFIKLKTPVQFSNLKRHFTNRYGEPKTTYYANDTQTVYRWKEGNVKLKLKIKEVAREMKLAVYYAPLADDLNQQQLESVPKDSWNPFPIEKGKIHRSAPLLNF